MKCTKCEKEFPLEMFTKDKSKPDGYRHECKECRSKHNKQRYIDNRDKIIEQTKQYAAEHREEKRKYWNEYYHTPINHCECLIKGYKKMDKKRFGTDETCDITKEWMLQQIEMHNCRYCGENDLFKLGLNRLDNTKPHTKDNVEVCCGDCNVKLYWNPNLKEKG